MHLEGSLAGIIDSGLPQRQCRIRRCSCIRRTCGAAAVIELSWLDADLSLRKPAAQFGEALSERLAEGFEVLARYGGAVLLCRAVFFERVVEHGRTFSRLQFAVDALGDGGCIHEKSLHFVLGLQLCPYLLRNRVCCQIFGL